MAMAWGARIGVARRVYFGYSREADAVIEAAIETMRLLGATIVDPANIPTANQIHSDPVEFNVRLYEFKADLETYLRSPVLDGRHRDVPEVQTLQNAIDYIQDHAYQEMPFFGQEIFLMAQAKGPVTVFVYGQALATSRRLARKERIDAVMNEHQLDALIAPTAAPA